MFVNKTRIKLGKMKAERSERRARDNKRVFVIVAKDNG